MKTHSELLEHRYKAALYHQVYLTAEKSKWVRLSGLGVGIVSGALTVVRQVCSIAEVFFKGLFYCVSGEIRLGLSHLFYETPKHLLTLPFSILAAVVDLIVTTALVGVSPVTYARKRWSQYAPKVLDKLLALGNAYHYGTDGKKKSGRLAEKSYLEAIESGQKSAMAHLGILYLYGDDEIEKNTKAALSWLRDAAKAEDPLGIKYLAAFLVAYPREANPPGEGISWMQKTDVQEVMRLSFTLRP